MFKNVCKLISITLVIAVLFSSCNGIFNLFSNSSEPSAPSAESSKESDFSTPPEEKLTEKPRLEDDFYTYINYDWLKSTELHDFVPRANSFSEVATDVFTIINQDLYDLFTQTEGFGNSDYEKLARFYYTSYDWENRNNDKYNPIAPYLDKIEKIKNIDELQDVAAEIDLDMIGSFIIFSIHPDKKDTSHKRLYLYGPPLIMSEKSYYFDESERGEVILDAYEKYILDLLALVGKTGKEATSIAQGAMEMEKYFAKSILSLEEAQDDDIIYNKFDLDEFNNSLENFDLKGFLTKVGLKNPDFIIITEVDYYKALDDIMVEENLEKIKDFMLVSTLNQATEFLSMDFIEAERDFVNIRNGTSGYREEFQESFFLTQTYMGEILDKQFIENHFSQEDKDIVEEMVKNIISQYEKRIENLDWMTDETKSKAIEKLEAMDIKIGYPDKWTDYTNLDVSIYGDGMDGSVFKNIKNIYHHGYLELLESLDQPVDESDWAMNAHDVNAYYNPTYNEIVFPAAILREPFFSKNYSESRNYGAIGSIIAHEISHAFDDSGRKFDKNGNRADWWTTEDTKNYEEKTSKLIEQFGNLEVSPGYNVNGKLTLSENISDLGGVTCVTDIVKALPDGDLKDMYEGYTTIWRSKSTKEYSINLLTDDVHAPDIFRANTILSNLDDFYETYDVKESDKMYIKKEDRIKIW